MTKRRRRYRKNPSTMTWLLLLGGGVGLYFLLNKGTAKGAPVAAPGAFVLRRDPSGAPMCFTAAGAKAPLSKCLSMTATTNRASVGDVGCGSLGCGGLGSLQG